MSYYYPYYYAYATKKKSTKKSSSSSKSTSSKPADLGAPGESIGPYALSHIHSSSSSHSTRSAKTKSTRSGSKSGSSSTKPSKSSSQLLPALPLGDPNASAQPKFRTASKSHPFLTTHGFAKQPEQGRPLSDGFSHTPTHSISSREITPGTDSQGNIIGDTAPGAPGFTVRGPHAHFLHTNPNKIQGGVGNPASTIHNISNRSSGGIAVPAPRPTANIMRLSPAGENKMIQQGSVTGHEPPNTSRPPFAGTNISVGKQFTGLLQGERKRLGGTSANRPVGVNVPASVGINDAMMQGKIPMSQEMIRQMSTGNAGGGIHDVPTTTTSGMNMTVPTPTPMSNTGRGMKSSYKSVTPRLGGSGSAISSKDVLVGGGPRPPIHISGLNARENNALADINEMRDAGLPDDDIYNHVANGLGFSQQETNKLMRRPPNAPPLFVESHASTGGTPQFTTTPQINISRG